MYNSHNSLKQISTEVKYTVATLNIEENKNAKICQKLNAKVPARLVLYFLSWSGFLVSFMMRNDMNFALVAMTTPTTNSSSQTNETMTSHNTSANGNETCHFSSTKLCSYYDWSSPIQSIILSSFFWCYVLSQVAGGIATQYFGTKRVFGWSQFATALCSLCMPICADWHYMLVIALRSIQGFASGLTWPAMYAVVGYWIPLVERSRFMSSFQGFSIGIGVTYALCGFIIEKFGWPYVFYTTGTLGMIWCLCWYLLAYNTPQEHPRISEKELGYIEDNISSEVKEALGMKVPWKSIFTSMPVWSIGITTFGRIWIHYVFIIYGPKFMQNILKFPYKENGFLSGMPFICSYIASVFFCSVADKVVLKNWMSLTNVRKLFTALSQIIPGLLIFAIGYIEDIVALLVVWFIAVTFITASYAGAMASIVDIAPNLAGPVLAFCQTIHMSASFLSPLINGIILEDGVIINQWRIVFGLSSVITIATYFIFQIYGTADIQKWNNSSSTSTSNDDGDNSIDEEQNHMLKKPNDDKTIPKTY
ncbi:sialin isoform X1 [Lucilia sericata]|uniref:sialin isoform X1 n=1 Tax=Lucilia sericata TaxID=13632 RepID=UPI0018A82892|nr:sialin isoform X1 [Lucilia sericata]XP_037814010.1 sialin isoform X1 [Lucilia sericata]XP_037814012.1 sialin isoform X1 [Lucilia sericata]